jgi:hypothetical protein
MPWKLSLPSLCKGAISREKDDTGRSIQIKVAGSFLISFWPDAFVRELRVINIEWI